MYYFMRCTFSHTYFLSKKNCDEVARAHIRADLKEQKNKENKRRADLNGFLFECSTSI